MAGASTLTLLQKHYSLPKKLDNPARLCIIAPMLIEKGYKMKDKLSWEMQAYGSPADEIIESVEDSITFKFSGPGMVIASYLSDAQELLASDQKNAARQYINIAKMLMMHYDLGFKRA